MPYTHLDDPEKLRRLLASVLMISADVDLPELLAHCVQEAKSLVGARYAALGVLNADRTGLEQFLTIGLADADETRIGPRPTGRGVLGRLITDPKPLRLANIVESPDRYGFPPNHPVMESFLGVPVRVKDDVYGNLYLTDKEDGGGFTEEDEALAEALALAAGIAIENHRLRDQARLVSVLDDRDRIARDLHDRVIQRVYAVGMSLNSATRLPERDQMIERISRAVDNLDATISDIRSAIFELGGSALPGGLRVTILHLLDELAPTLGSRPEASFEGAIDNIIPPHVADQVIAVVREGLTNAGKHAEATRFNVVVVAGDQLTVEIVDNGRGIELPLSGPGLGLTNLRDRATQLGGTFEVLPVESGGTRLEWCVPL